MDADVVRKLRELEEIAAFLRGEIRRRERELIQTPSELREKINMLRRTAEVIGIEMERIEELRRGRQPRQFSSTSFPFRPNGSDRGPPGPGRSQKGNKRDNGRDNRGGPRWRP